MSPIVIANERPLLAKGNKAYLAGLLALLLAMSVLIYWPGLQSVFLLDDYQNLKALEAIRPGFWFEGARDYVTSGVAGPLGRYLPLASFALQYQAWPSDPAAFKAVNLAIHLTTGLLLFVLWRALGRCSGMSDRRADALALISAGIWLLHPVNVSSVLYVVQRMTQLSALFTVAGLVAYVHGRDLLSASHRSGWAWTTGGVLLGTVLAATSKETGLLLPVYALVLEFTLLAGVRKPRGWGIWVMAFLAAPIAAGSAYLALRFQSWILPTYALRDFTPLERVLTQARVLVDYLHALVMPTPGVLGLFRDDYAVSRGLLEPASTLAAVMLVLGLVTGAFWLRRKVPAISFAILWYFGGHLMESTVIPLELYFEHRNYLPAAGLIYGGVVAFSGLVGSIKTPPLRITVRVAGIAWLFLVGLVTVLETRLWGQPLTQAAAWARERPQSLRAQEWLGNAYAMTGNFPEAAEAFRQLAEGNLHHAPGYVLWAKAACYDPRVEGPPLGQASQALRTTAFTKGVWRALEELVTARESGQCDRLSQDALVVLVTSALQNPELASRMAPQLWGLLGRLQAADGQVDSALASWNQAFTLQPDAETALRQAQLLAAHGRSEEALGYLARARTAPGSQRAAMLRRIEAAERDARAAANRGSGG
jgi:hypothetical protein